MILPPRALASSLSSLLTKLVLAFGFKLGDALRSLAGNKPRYGRIDPGLLEKFSNERTDGRGIFLHFGRGRR